MRWRLVDLRVRLSILQKNLNNSPVGLVPKSDGSWRLITHLSCPKGGSVNDGISDDLSSVNYTSFDTVVDKIFKLGFNTEGAKRCV